jgi:hypothetical protein
MSARVAPFVRSATGFHRELDATRLARAWAGIDLGPSLGITVSSPAHVAALEHFRSSLGGLRSAKAVSCDAFVWALGEPPLPHMTKVGGTPYLPRSVPWPVIDGVQATFLAQFNFADSRDLVPDVPADVLLVFLRDEQALYEEGSSGYDFYWVTVRDRPMWTRRSLPRAELAVPTMWGVRHRTFDDRTQVKRVHRAHDAGAPWGVLQLPVLAATKIGGLPFDAQDAHAPVPRGTRLLCQLASIQAPAGVPWPFANRREPLAYARRRADRPDAAAHRLMLSDMGVVRFFLDRRGAVLASLSGS